MTKRFLLPVLLITLLVHACGVGQSLPLEQNTPTPQVSQPETVDPISEPTQEIVQTPVTEATSVAETMSPDCLGGEVSPIGESIADEYDFTDYAEVVTWFCNGAEFEDILVALETESQSGTPAEELLQMLADGFTWEEIWRLTGLTE
ncbi:MAG: hypothetical protein WBL25_18405 [Anaerolineales bacterium]